MLKRRLHRRLFILIAPPEPVRLVDPEAVPLSISKAAGANLRFNLQAACAMAASGDHETMIRQLLARYSYISWLNSPTEQVTHARMQPGEEQSIQVHVYEEASFHPDALTYL
jgi:hypothetical protein